MKTNSIEKSFTIEKILKINFPTFHISWKPSKSKSWNFSVVYTMKLSWNTHFMKCSERNISWCILAFRQESKILKVPHTSLNLNTDKNHWKLFIKDSVKNVIYAYICRKLRKCDFLISWAVLDSLISISFSDIDYFHYKYGSATISIHCPQMMLSERT